MLRKPMVVIVLLLWPLAPAAGQSMRDRVENLFRFGDCGPDILLCLRNTSGQDAALAFSDALEAGNGLLVQFVADAIGLSVASIPTPATSSGAVVEFTPGGRIQTRLLSGGPIYAERAPSLGRGNVLFGALLTQLRFTELRGAPIGDLLFNFRHVDIPGTPGLGNPIQENNVLQVRLALDVRTVATSFFVTYGLTNTLDVGVAVPVVHTSMSGRSDAQIVPFGSGSVYSFGGPAEDPRVRETSYEDGSAIGVGDVGMRLKLNLRQGRRIGYAVQGDLRLPTGSQDDLLGLGHVAIRLHGVASAEFGDLTPHLNLGYLFRGRPDSLQNHALVVTAGFDQVLPAGITLAVDVLSELELDRSALRVPGDIQFTEPFTRVVPATTIPDTRDSRVDAAFGFKWAVPCTETWRTLCATGADRGVGVTFISAVLVPLNRGGLRSGIVWSAGAQYKF
jgi:hypothetical protein